MHESRMTILMILLQQLNIVICKAFRPRVDWEVGMSRFANNFSTHRQVHKAYVSFVNCVAKSLYASLPHP